MKNCLVRLTVACVVLVVGGIQARGDKVPLTQTPAAVQKAIQELSKGEPVERIDRKTKDGKVVYQVEFKRKGLNRRLKFAEDGSVLNEKRGFADVTTSPELNALPAPVQKTLEEQRAGRTVADIRKVTWDRKTVYKVEFDERGLNSRIYIAMDGSIVAARQHGGSLFTGTQLSDTPKAVQDTVKRAAADAEIADIERKTQDGEVIYKVDIRQKGQNRRLLVLENGTLVSDSEARGGAPSTSESTTGKVREKTRELFGGGQTVSLDQTPNAVQQTIKDNTGASVLKSIKQEQKDGVTCYAVEFEKEGKNTRLKIAQDGRILEDSRK